MENNWPEAVDELLEECQRLISRCDLYTLGERGEPLPGEAEPRVDGTDYLAGEYRYGVAMIPAQWVTHVIDAATVGRGTCKMEQMPECQPDDISCSECGVALWAFSMDMAGEGVLARPNYCPYCGTEVDHGGMDR